MFQSGDSVLACVSGGADSVAMLLLLNETKDILGINITVVHVNHMIRGSEADRDECFVRNLSSGLSIPFISEHIDIPKIAKSRNESLELVARDERYKFFNSLNFDKICTAHTKSDCIETFIMNFSRGCGLNGLTSIPPVRNNIVRPVIDFFRNETEYCCAKYGYDFVTDSTNLVADCTRNKVRLKLIPEMTQIFSGFENNVARCISGIYDDEICLSSIANSKFNEAFDRDKYILNVESLSDVPSAILSRVVIIFLNNISAVSPEKIHIDYICENFNNKFSVTIPGGVTICGNGKFIYQLKLSQNSQFTLRLSKYDINDFDFNGNHFTVSPIYGEINSVEPGALLIDFNDIDDYFEVRTRLPGDKIKIKKRNCTKSIKKLYNELKISQQEKESALFFVDSKGIFAISGFENSINKSNKTNSEYLLIKFRRY